MGGMINIINYSELLIEHTNKENVNDICISIVLDDIILPFAFIREETDDCLVIDNTDEKGYEKIVIVPKKNIVTLSLVYADEVDAIFGGNDISDEQGKKMYQ